MCCFMIFSVLESEKELPNSECPYFSAWRSSTTRAMTEIDGLLTLFSKKLEIIKTVQE